MPRIRVFAVQPPGAGFYHHPPQPQSRGGPREGSWTLDVGLGSGQAMVQRQLCRGGTRSPLPAPVIDVPELLLRSTHTF